MTPAEKLALCRRSYAAFSPPDIDAILPLYHPDCEWQMGYAGAALGTETFRGHEGIRAWVAALAEGFENLTTAIDEARVTGAGILLVRGHNYALSTSAQVELSMQNWQEIEFSEGLILRVAEFDGAPAAWDEATPLDLGLTPDTGT